MGKIKKISMVLLIIILIAGTAMIVIKGLNFGLIYAESNRVEIFIGKNFDVQEIHNIANEVFGKQNSIQKVEYFDEVASITVKQVTDEQKEQLVQKVNEKYGTENKAEELKVVAIPNYRGRDIIKHYITIVLISILIIAVYMAIRYHKIGMIKIPFITILSAGIAEWLLLSLLAITRLPVNRLTLCVGLAVLVIVYTMQTVYAERKLKDWEEKEKINA